MHRLRSFCACCRVNVRDNRRVEERPYTDEEVAAQMDKICASSALADNHKKLLRYLVPAALDATTDSSMFTGDALSWDVFKVTSTTSPMGKQYGNQLRQRLTNYYDTQGRDDLIEIRIPAGTYRPVFNLNTDHSEALPKQAEDHLGWALRGISVCTGESLWRACEYLAKGLTLAPGHPKLLTKFLFAMWELATQGHSHSRTVPLIQSCLTQCKDKNIHSWEVLYVEACLIGVCDWDWEKAFELAGHANRRSNQRARFRPFYRALQLACGRFNEAIDTYRALLYDSPHSDQLNSNDFIALANIHTFMGDHAQAEALIRELVANSPSGLSYASLAMHLMWANRPDEALALLEDAPCDQSDKDIHASRILIKSFMGDRAEARERLAEAQAYDSKLAEETGLFSEQQIPMAMVIALLAVAANELDLAVDSIERAVVRERHPSAFLLPPSMVMSFRPLHNHDGFRNLMQRLHFPFPPRH